MEGNTFKWLNEWYINNCDGYWEHHYGIKIETIDNPGWSITIDTEGSTQELEDLGWIFIENDSNDWYGYKVEEKKFEASGDPSKLNYLVNLFKETIENKV